jgi:cellulase
VLSESVANRRSSQCFNLKVTGSGTASPPGVLGTQIYKKDEPGIVFDIYKKFKALSDYPVPGPAVFDGTSTGGSVPAPAVSSTPVTPSTPSSVASPAKGGSYAEGAASPLPSAVAAPASGGYGSAPPAPKASTAPETKKKHKTSCRKHPRDLQK